MQQNIPNICFASVSFSIDDFRAHPVGGAGDRFDSRPRHTDGLNALARPEISQLHISRGVPQNVSACEETLVDWVSPDEMFVWPTMTTA